MSFRMEIGGSVALVTGAGSGIGRATALEMARRGAHVLCVDIDSASAEKTAAGCVEAGAPGSSGFAVDVSDRDGMGDLAAGINSEHGALDILVNNAGVGMTGRFAEMTADDWAWIRGVNLDGVVNGCAVFAPAMLDRGRGHVVNVSSGLAYTYTKTEPAYVATKAAVLALSRCLRNDWHDSGVGVTAICPGVIKTPIIEATRFVGSQDDPAVREKTRRLFRRGHKPEKVASAIVTAIERDKSVVPVGAEAWLGWGLHRLLPVRVQQALSGLRP